MTSLRIRSAALSCLLATLASPSSAGDSALWPEFRGPTQDGRVVGALPLDWSEDQNVLWKTPIQGRGWSTPVVTNGRAWFTTATTDGHELYVVAVDIRTGEVVQESLLFEVEEPLPINSQNSYASPSPVTDGERVYVHFGTYGTVALDSSGGEVLWQRRDLNCDHEVGPGSSPFLHGDHLVLHMDGTDVQYVVALDKSTGETIWETKRAKHLEEVGASMRKAFSTPIVIAVDDQEQLISSGAVETFAYDPANGETLWQVRHGGFSMTSRPLEAHGMVILNTGFMRTELLAVRLDGQGDVSETHVVWKQRRNAPKMASPVLVGDLLFLVSDSGIASCLNARTGEQHWSERLGADYCASPIATEERVYFFDREGNGFVVAAEEEFRLLAESSLDAGMMASPVVVDGDLLLRTETHLYRITGRGATGE